MPTFMTTQFSHQLFEIHSLILNLSTTQGPYPFSHSSNWPFSSGSSDYTWKWSILAVWLQHKLSSHSFHIWGASPRIRQQLHSLDSTWERASKLALPVHSHCLVFLKSWKCVHAILLKDCQPSPNPHCPSHFLEEGVAKTQLLQIFCCPGIYHKRHRCREQTYGHQGGKVAGAGAMVVGWIGRLGLTYIH